MFSKKSTPPSPGTRDMTRRFFVHVLQRPLPQVAFLHADDPVYLPSDRTRGSNEPSSSVETQSASRAFRICRTTKTRAEQRSAVIRAQEQRQGCSRWKILIGRRKRPKTATLVPRSPSQHLGVVGSVFAAKSAVALLTGHFCTPATETKQNKTHTVV